MSYFLAGLLQGVFWWLVLGVALWLVRKLAPSLEVPLFKVGVFDGIGILIRRTRIRLQRPRPGPHVP